jgi:hypothetical protein
MEYPTIRIQQIQSIDFQKFLTLLQQHSEIVLMQGNTPIAKIIGLHESLEDKAERIPDLHPGAWVSDNFND